MMALGRTAGAVPAVWKARPGESVRHKRVSEAGGRILPSPSVCWQGGLVNIVINSPGFSFSGFSFSTAFIPSGSERLLVERLPIFFCALNQAIFS